MLGVAFLAHGKTEAHIGRDWTRAINPRQCQGLQTSLQHSSVVSHTAWGSRPLPNRQLGLVLWPWVGHACVSVYVLPGQCLREAGTHYKLLVDSESFFPYPSTREEPLESSLCLFPQSSGGKPFGKMLFVPQAQICP